MVVIAIAVLVLLLAGGVVLGLHFWYYIRNEVPFVLAPNSVLEQIVYALDPEHARTIIDLGSGDGRVLEACRRATKKAKLIGIDNNPLAIALCRLRLRGQARLVRGDIIKADLTGCDRVFCYLSDQFMATLEPIFHSQLKPGTRVVSLQFPLPNKKPTRVMRLKDGRSYAANLYIYDYEKEEEWKVSKISRIHTGERS